MANGLFNLKQVMQAIQQGGWPAQKPPAVEYLVVAGGGGAGSYGGGGGGGLLTGLDPVPNGQTLLVTVGGGGNGAQYGVTGSNSVFGQISASGGGGGGQTAGGTGTKANGLAGGSGGGAGCIDTASGVGVGGQGTFGQGNAGGTTLAVNTSPYPGSGGGGAGTIGLSGVSTVGGSGGAGIASAINGTVTTYAGGGGGAVFSTAGTGGVAGVGGGGRGGVNGGTAGTAGTANTGGGGGGIGDGAGSGYNGGSGIVVVSYPDVYAAATATTGSPTVSTSGSGSISYNGSSNVYWNNNNSNVGTSSFTLEGWFNPNSTATSNIIRTYNNVSIGILVVSGVLKFYLSSDGSSFNVASAVGTGSVSTSTWYHFALVRNNTVFTIYLNGVASGTVTSSASIFASAGFNIGAEQNGSAITGFNGYITNVRMVVGTAIYTSNFTPPTAPLTAITNTTFLFNVNSGSLYTDSSGLTNTPLTAGTPTWNASSPFATGAGYKNRVYTWTSSGSITF
jgi:hypothetical protein